MRFNNADVPNWSIVGHQDLESIRIIDFLLRDKRFRESVGTMSDNAVQFSFPRKETLSLVHKYERLYCNTGTAYRFTAAINELKCT